MPTFAHRPSGFRTGAGPAMWWGYQTTRLVPTEAELADLVPFLEQGQAGADGFVAVQVHEAVKARADPAEEPAPLAARSRRPPCPLRRWTAELPLWCCRVEP